MSNSKSLTNQNSKERYLSAFIMGFLCVFASVLPIMIIERGYFIYYGDYNAQQIPFYILANNAVHSGQLGWNWFTDLGSDFLTSYSFYLSGSPFFWLSTLLPKALVTLSMPFLLSLKHALAALTAYIYIRKFVRNKDAALIGALLYSYSGFQIFNIFFNHFQDVTALFPLMLIAMEENINNGRKGFFAVTVAMMSVINYFFFTGQVVFLIIYYLVRVPCPDFHTSWKKFRGLVLEAVLGTMIGCFMLLPSALAILGNNRVNEHLYGQDMVLYSDKTRIARLIQTFFMPSDSPARPNLFNSDNAKWASIGGYLPLFSMIGVITFMKSKKKHWATSITLICIICAFVPVLNSMFYAFNGSYYARWFYMPILILAMMTAQTLDDENADTDSAVKICAAMLAAFAVISILPTKKDDKISFFDFPRDIYYFGITLIIAVISLIAAAILLQRKKRSLPFMQHAVCLTITAAFVCTLTSILYGACSVSSAKNYINSSIKGTDSVYEKVSEDNFFRTDISENCDNYPMAWGLPSMRAFQSVVSSSIMEFYDKIGIQRDVASRPELSHYTLRGLLSVKYFYNEIYEDNKNDIEKSLPGFKYADSNEYFEIYENEYYIPMGFGYDLYISEDDADKKGNSIREALLMKSLVLSDKQIEKYSDILSRVSENDSTSLNKGDYERFCLEKQQNCSSEFTYDSSGFESKITLDKPQLVFFSVPYSDGWTAEVNGKPADIEKVSYGFMAVKADTGDNIIKFSYVTPGLKTGIIISCTGAAGLLIYLIVCRKRRKKSSDVLHTHYYDYTPTEKLSSADSYCRRITKKK